MFSSHQLFHVNLEEAYITLIIKDISASEVILLIIPLDTGLVARGARRLSKVFYLHVFTVHVRFTNLD